MCHDCESKERKCKKKSVKVLTGNSYWNFGEAGIVTIPNLLTLHADGTVSYDESPSPAVPGIPNGLLGSTGHGKWEKKCGVIKVRLMSLSNQKSPEAPGPGIPFIKCTYEITLRRGSVTSASGAVIKAWVGDFTTKLRTPQTDLPFAVEPIAEVSGKMEFVKFVDEI